MKKRLESRLLSMLRPGEMLRFCFVRIKGQQLALNLEGAGDNSSGLSERIATVLKACRGDGYHFLLEPQDANISAAVVEHEHAETFVELFPLSRKIRVMCSTPIGFAGNATECHQPDGIKITLPDFPVTGGRNLVDYPVALLEEEHSITELKIEFLRMTLPDELVAPVTHALKEDIDMRRQIHGAEFPATAQSAFLALWLSQRTGWTVRCRIGVRHGHSIPTGTLEVLGREIFGAECLILEDSETTAPDTSDLLIHSYPDGWPFPPILPALDEIGSLSAERIHNSRVPKLPESGVVAGLIEGKEVRLPIATRDRHIYVVGGTGTGKSTLLKRLIRFDLKRKESLVLLDPHGDLYHEILSSLPKNRRDDVVCIDPGSDENPIAFNPLDFPRDKFVGRRSEFLVGELIRFFRQTWDNPEAFGPIFETYFRNALRLLIHQDGNPHTLMEFDKVFVDEEFRKSLIAGCRDKSVKDFWTGIAEKVRGDASLANCAPYITSKTSVLTQSGFLSEMISQPIDELRLEERMNRGGVILVNLNKGVLGAAESRLLGVLLTMQIFAAGLKRSTMPSRDRRPINVYIDEFQNVVSDNAASMLSEARKFGIRMNLANQTLAQLGTGRGRTDMLETVLGNVGTMIAFRLGVPDAARLRPFLQPFSPEQIQGLPNYHALIRLLDENGPIGPLVMKTLKS